MDYQEALKYMLEKLPMFHRIGKAAYKANLDNANALDSYFKWPHRNYKTIHVAGTNGKGSVSHCIAAILQKAGYKTGLFTSPHLKDFRERIRINGEMISENYVTDFITSHQSLFDTIKPSFFELTSAMAFEYFKQEKVDVAVIEVGMGGRLDSTNIITPALSVITNIGMDHTEFLGDTLQKIAREKAGIIKPNAPVVIGEYTNETLKVFRDIADKLSSQIILAQNVCETGYSFFTHDRKQVFQVKMDGVIRYPNLTLDLGGLYQQKNICTVLTSIIELRKQGLKIEDVHIYSALEKVSQLTGLQGRWQVIGNNPLIVCDTGHNYDGIEWVIKQINTISFKKLHIVLGFVNDKSIDKILTLFPVDATYYFTQANIPRALDAKILQSVAGAYKLSGNFYNSVHEAFETAKNDSGKDDLIFVGGSTFVVAEII